MQVKLDERGVSAYAPHIVERLTVVWLRRIAASAVVASILVVGAHALRDRFNAFPDEELHVVTAAFYREHWLPPTMGPALAPLAAVHGMSYHMLWPPQATYWLYAKASILFAVAANHTWLLYRGLSVLLWGSVVLMVLRRLSRAPWLFWLVGLTPGVWYLYSYFCPDALSYAVAVVLTMQMGLPDSVSRRYLATGSPRWGALVLGVAIGLLALSKLNYLTFSATAFAYACVLLWRQHDSAYLRRALGVLVVACCVAGPFLVTDLVRNGTHSEYESLRDSLAGPGFRTSDIRDGTAYYGYALRDRGVPASALFHRPWRWGLLTLRSFFGVYGTMNVNPLPWLNDVQGFIALGVLVLLVFATRRRLTRDQRILVGVAGVMCVAAVGAAFWRAWTFDFQAQGRYCFAVIPIVVLVALDVCDEPRAILHWGLAACCAIASVISLASALPYLA